MSTTAYLMASIDELFEDNLNYSVVSIEEYFEAVDRETIKRSHRAAKTLTNYLKSHSTKLASSRVSRINA